MTQTNKQDDFFFFLPQKMDYKPIALYRMDVYLTNSTLLF